MAWALAAAFIAAYLLAGGSPSRYSRSAEQTARNRRAAGVALIVVVVAYAVARVAGW